MNRFFSIFVVVVASCSLSFSQSTNIVGTGSETVALTNLQFSGEAGVPSANIENIAELQVAGSLFIGGDDDETNLALNQNGSSALRVDAADLITVENSDFQGGNGGARDAATATLSEANGGHGIEVLGSSSLAPLADGIVAVGGAGGLVSYENGQVQTLGGNGVSIDSFSGENLDVLGGSYRGGNGGSATMNDAADLQLFQTRGANGGHGIFFGNILGKFADTITLSGGSFVGGDGGDTTNSSGSAFADGGSGVYIQFSESLVVSGGDFAGGDAGVANGVQGVAGSGLQTLDVANISITGGNFTKNQGVLLESLSLPEANISILGGEFSVAEFRATKFIINGNLINTPVNRIDISGGSIGDIVLSGDAENDLNISGAPSLGGLQVAGAGINNISLASSVYFSEGITQSGGTANIIQWDDSHFTDTTIYGGTMNFSGHGFNLTGGSSFALMDSTSVVNFYGGFTAESGSQITTTYDGPDEDDHSTIRGSDLVFEEGAKWIVNGVSTITNGATILMASATLSLSNNLLNADVDYIGGSWASGLTLGKVGMELFATNGFVPLQDALDLEPGTDFYEAMEQLSAFTNFENTDDSEYADLKALSAEAAAATLADNYVRAPEMASTLIQLQGLFADQITDRARSFRRYKSSGSSYAPQGPNGWSDSLPKWDLRQSAKDFDESLPRWNSQGGAKNTSKDAYNHPPKSAKSKIEVPATYQVWGRGYGSYFKQSETTGFGGYEATIGGGVIGLDKRFNNLLLGLGGGYAHTVLNGNWGSDAEADTGYGTAYAAINGGKGFIDFNVNYAFSDVETEGSSIMGYEGAYDASTLGIYIGGGLDLSTCNDLLLFTPEVSLLSTYYDRDSYTETSTTLGPYPDKAWDAYDQWSYLGSLGATLSTIRQLESFNLEMEFQPEIRAHWLHEFNADMDDDSYLMQGGGGTPIGVALQAREEDLLKVGTGIRFSKWNSDKLEFGLDFDGIFGQDYEAYIFSGKLLHRF